MNSSIIHELADTLRDANEILDLVDADPKQQKPDHWLFNSYLSTFAPYLADPQAPSELLRTAARLYCAEGRYQEAIDVLDRLQDPGLNDLRARCTLCSSCCAAARDWASRQEDIWSALQDLEPTLLDDDETEEAANRDLQEAWDHLLPTERMRFTYLNEELEGKYGMIHLAAADGIYSLFPLQYLTRHIPTALSRNWFVSLDAEEVSDGSIRIGGRELGLGNIAVRITPAPGFHAGPKVDLALWHPALRDMMRKDRKYGTELLHDLMDMALPHAAAYLSLGSITAAEAPFGAGEETVKLRSLGSWLQDHGMEPYLTPEEALSHRVYAFTREPSSEIWPRGDIVRGETCMPELEEIYFLRNGMGLSALQRYGVGHWFLIFPRYIYEGNFPLVRDALIHAVRAVEGDKVLFTGWAEGTRSYYLDFLSLSSTSVLDTLQQYLATQIGGQDIQICSFYWGSLPNTVDDAVEKAQQALDAAATSRKPFSPEHPVQLEEAFLATRWEKREEAGWDLAISSPYDTDITILESIIQYLTFCDMQGASYDYVQIHSALESALPEDDAPNAGDDLWDRLATVLLTMERFRESAKWNAKTADSQKKTTRLYSCYVCSCWPDGQYQWESRRRTFWKWFAAADARLVRALGSGDSGDAQEELADQIDAVFPREEALLLPPAAGGKPILRTGLPGGILTLPAMLYLTSHYPEKVGRHWDVAISWDGAPLEHLTLDGQTVSLQDIQVSLTDLAGKVSLALWHPVLSEIAQKSAENARDTATRLLNAALPMGARLLYIADISVAPEEPQHAFPLSELRQQMQDMGYLPDVPLDTLLSRRRYTITRKPRDTGRPRADIFRGETCMPELEYIYHRLYEEGQTILERHGLSALFLMIPNQLCGGDPAQYRQQLQRYLTHAEGDKVFFTGWAEGSEYCYLDLISMHGHTLLRALNEYALSNPGGRELRYCTFFWDSKPLSWVRADAEPGLFPGSQEEYAAFAKAHLPKDLLPVPDAESAAALEASFHAAFTPEDLCAPAAPEAPEPVPQTRVVGKKKPSKAQRKAQNSGKKGKKKR